MYSNPAHPILGLLPTYLCTYLKNGFIHYSHVCMYRWHVKNGFSRNCRVVHKNQHSLAMRIVGSTDFYREKNNENKAQKDVIEKPILTCHLHSIPT